MARSDLLVNLVKAASSGDSVQFQKALDEVIVDERGKHHHVLADRLSQLKQLKPPMQRHTNGNGISDNIFKLIHERIPERNLEDLTLPETVKASVLEAVEEYQRKELLRAYNLEPRHRILLVGPPGNGKTSLAEAIASTLFLPLFIVRYEGLIGSYLGETTSRLATLFEFVRQRECVLFFDEFDVVGKERGDTHDTGEIKRVVSSLLLQVDALPSHVVVITATNHAELLDRAVWRRFQLRLSLPAPDREQIKNWFYQASNSIKSNLKLLNNDMGVGADTFAKALEGASYAELEDFRLDVLRRYVLTQPNANIKTIVRDRLKFWQARYSPAELFDEEVT